MTRRQSSPAYEQVPDTEKPVRQSAKCWRCDSMLDFVLNGMGVVLEICPHCDEGKPLRVRTEDVHRCDGCGEVMPRETYALDERHCRRCRPLYRNWNKCVDCDANCRATRCANCTRLHNLAVSRKREQERRGRLDFYHRRQGNGN